MIVRKIRRKVSEDLRPNTHQKHLEQLVFMGRAEIDELNGHIESFIAQMKGEDRGQNTTVKIDGAPACIMFSNVVGHPKNSICLKSFVNGPKNDISTPEEVDARYGDRQSMSKALKYCLQLAKWIPAGEAWQGDCLFVNETKEEQEINGVNCITFNPNTIKYAFTENSPYYEKIKRADFGVALHTIYTFDENGKLQQNFKVDINRVKVPKNFCILPHFIQVDNSKVDLTALENKYAELRELEKKIYNDPDYELLVHDKKFNKFSKVWEPFENSRISDKKQVTLNVDEFFDDFVEFLKDWRYKELYKNINKWKEDNKTPERIAAAEEKDALESDRIIKEVLETNKELLVNMVKCFNCAAECKTIIWNGYKDIPLGYDTYAEHRVNGWFPTSMEGIAMSDKDGNIVKIVDRPGFSNLNRDPNIVKGFERNGNTRV